MLRPGGRLGISDLVGDDHADPATVAEAAASVGAVTGVLTQSGCREGLENAGFTDVTVTPSVRVADGVDSVIVQALRP